VKILIHSNGPMVPSGYGQQVKLLAPRLKKAGHDVAISAFYGLSGSAITWEGIPILPAGRMDFGPDVIVDHARNHGADVVITLMDFWKLAPAADALRDVRVLAWLPVDCEPLGRPDRQTLLRSGAQPVAMSRFGQHMLQEQGFSALYAPHAVDTSVFKPPADRRALRRELGLDEFFVIGICAANSDGIRKAWPEQLSAFAQFAVHHPEARLLIHSHMAGPGGLPLAELAEALGIADKVIFSDQYALTSGLMTDAMMADWFGCLDLLSACSYAEGFGVPIMEAQACGVPVVSTEASAMPEITWDYSVPGDPWWNPVHRAWWTRPDVNRIVSAYQQAFYAEEAAHGIGGVKDRVRHAADYDIKRVVAEHWLPLLHRIEVEQSDVRLMDAVSAYPPVPSEAAGASGGMSPVRAEE
jgi:glycosyltransferase involved in cell wall biosynthesis